MEVAGNDPNILSAIAIIETAERIVNGYVAEFQIWHFEMISINCVILFR